MERKREIGYVSGGKIIILLIAFLIIALIILNALLPLTGIGGCIGLIKIQGTITSEKEFGATDSEEIVNLLDEAERRPDIRGIMIEINSGGGSAFASKEIYQKLKSIKKPKLAYIKDAGASGAYLAALGADYIFADSTSITGSIGARATLIDVSKALDKLGINVTTIKSGEKKDMADLFRSPTEEELSLLKNITNEIFYEFRDIVIKERNKSRNFDMKKFEKVLDGRMLLGKEAYDLGLIDNIASRERALEFLGEVTGLGERPNVCVLQPKRDVFSMLFSEFANLFVKNSKSDVSLEYK
jgi:protease-4